MLKKLLVYQKNVYPLHMPGHKLGRLCPMKDINLYHIDGTEVPELDHLYQPQGIIKDAQNMARELYGSQETFFLINGSSSGLLTAISASCRYRDKIIVARNCHKSVYNAICINQLDPVYIYPEIISEYNMVGGINPESVKKALEKHSDARCVVITSPTYEGFVSDIQKIAKIVHENNKILIVDEAHGAHFPFHSYFPNSALDNGADIVIQSLHKTLPSLTGTALFHVNSHRVSLDRVKEYLSIYQTSSPSYILMTGLASCLEVIHENSRYFDIHVDNLVRFRKHVDLLSKIKIIGNEITNDKKNAIQSIDLSKLVFVGKKNAIYGKQLESILRNQYKFQLELSTPTSGIAITSIADPRKMYKKLYKCIKKIDGTTYLNTTKFGIIKEKIYHKKVLTPYEAKDKNFEQIPYLESKERIAADYLYLYPPGIPFLVPGEYIDQSTIDDIQQYTQLGFTVEGLHGHNIKVVVQ